MPAMIANAQSREVGNPLFSINVCFMLQRYKAGLNTTGYFRIKKEYESEMKLVRIVFDSRLF